MAQDRTDRNELTDKLVETATAAEDRLRAMAESHGFPDGSESNGQGGGRTARAKCGADGPAERASRTAMGHASHNE